MDSSLAQRCADTARGLTVPALLHRNATEFGDLPALSTLGAPGTLTWRELRDRVAATARGLAELGLGAGDRMLIMMSSRVEHWLVDLAAVHLGAIPSTVYATLAPAQLNYLAQHSGARILVLEDEADLAKWEPLPEHVEHVLLLDRDLPRLAAQPADPETFEKTWRAVQPDQPVTLLYTSGTTGDPKGVVLTHHNVIYQSVVLEATVETPDHAPSLAYLPLAHIAERMLGVYNAIYRAGHVTICPDPAQLLAGLIAVRPISFFGVPRIWEKFVAGIQAQLAAADPAVRNAVDTAREVALQAYKLREAGQPLPPELATRLDLVDTRVLRPLRARLGLDNVVWPGSGAAPIPVEVLLYLAGIGIDVLEVWGMTETTGTATLNTPGSFRTGSVGRVNPGMELKLAEDGEILVRGPLVCAGYLRPDGGVEPVTDADGWLATGDVGTLDADGFLTITDRKKELIINSAGKNIAPAQIENLLRAHPLIAQAVAIGDRRPYVTALIVLDEETVPAWAARQGITAATLEALATDPALLAEITAAVRAANDRLSRPEQVKRFHVLPTGWTPETGELTPTLKLRRRVVQDRYADAIDALYAG
ncbi:long-chain acyl-CoA synthetase [Actinoplanes octamycinicus]|uniref:Acyl-CoA synthetase n=1 Tax=Actinoplanes octamycinicus TaxID=135948 RepID=A0A7W7GXS1_9ACTN|nr:AMP-dependent synthetase/ligase [Actinoplanes octamycinicus]MBB4740264.1 long-chain acyl-CoA synthetase [Actinoplanes octamycinicus]GIE63478.1 long-chain acyl-CoA synthetase [Actinoplanes octamycinicus]